MTETAQQCEVANVYSMLLMLIFHGAYAVFCRGDVAKRMCVAALIASGINIVALREIVFLTIMHQIMGMMAFEGAIRFLRGPLVVAKGHAEACTLLALFVVNFLIVIGETVMAFRAGEAGLRAVVFDDAGLAHFGRMPFYQKQHAVLHFFLCVLIASILTSLHPRWRTSTTAQQARIIIEPCSIVGVALILFTHHHGTTAPDLASHPTIGLLICIASALQVISYIAHLAIPTADGSVPDVTQPLPRGGPPVVRMIRAINAFAYLLLAYFLYVDSYMEYLGCRYVLLKPHATSGDERLGLDSSSELGTYLALACVGAALALACLLACGPTQLLAEAGARDSDLAMHALLPACTKARGGEQRDDEELGPPRSPVHVPTGGRIAAEAA